MKLLPLCLCIVSLTLSACVGNPHLTPERWVTVLNSNTGQPVAGVPLAYRLYKTPQFKFIVRLEQSDPYVSGADGRAFVPNDQIMVVVKESEWRLDYRKTYGTADDPIGMTRVVDVYYVRQPQPPPSAK
jgi:hypothetical protein